MDLGGRLGSWVDVQTVLRGHAVAGLCFHGEVVLRREPELSDHLVFDVTWIPDSISSTYKALPDVRYLILRNLILAMNDLDLKSSEYPFSQLYLIYTTSKQFVRFGFS